MRLSIPQNSDVRKTAGLRLRCFLDRVLWVLLLTTCVGLHAQVAMPTPIHLTHVDGLVTNTSGKPVAGIEVTLSRNETVVATTRTDQAGTFRFDHVKGRYWLRVARSEYAPAAREVAVSDELVTRLERKKLYIVLGPGACMDECSSFFTSQGEFEKAIRRNTEHH